jgi:UDP-3-O-[3-hydroxymyristoyl] glucosamine N-acyltransferase
VIIHAGTILGADAFTTKKTRWRIWPLLGGRVVIKDNGIGTLYNKGVTGDTTIGEGTKIDNQVHRSRSYWKKCLIASQTGIAGCHYWRRSNYLGTSRNHKWITIGAKAVILGQTGVTKSVEGGNLIWTQLKNREKNETTS